MAQQEGGVLEAYIPLIVAGIAFFGVGVNAWLAVYQGRKTRTQAMTLANAAETRATKGETRRDWWQRFDDTVSRLSDPDDRVRSMAVVVLSAMVDLDWAEATDKELLLQVLKVYNGAAVAAAKGGGRHVN